MSLPALLLNVCKVRWADIVNLRTNFGSLPFKAREIAEEKEVVEKYEYSDSEEPKSPRSCAADRRPPLWSRYIEADIAFVEAVQSEKHSLLPSRALT